MSNIKNSELMNIRTIDKIASEDDIILGEWCLIDLQDTDKFFSIGRYGAENEVFDDEGKVLVCSDAFESNLVIFKSNSKTYRVLNNELGNIVTPLSLDQATALIQRDINSKQKKIMDARNKIQEVINLISMANTAQSSSTAVAIVSDNALMQQKTELKEVHAKNIEKYNEQIEETVRELHATTMYYGLPATIGISSLGRTKEVVDEKLHELSLYGGLDEDEVDISVGGVVHESVPIHIFQNLKHMDVEAIIGYESGGIGLSNINSFNEWLAIPENRNRVLPKEKCIVAIKTRKYREFSVGFFKPENRTFIYMRNGENIRMLQTNLSIGSTLLATENDVMSSYAKPLGSLINNDRQFAFISKNDYEALTEHANNLKPLWLDILLTAYKEQLKYFSEVIGYAEHRHRLLSEQYKSLGKQSMGYYTHRPIMLGKENTTAPHRGRYEYLEARYKSYGKVDTDLPIEERLALMQDRFQLTVELQRKVIQKTKANIQKITDHIKNGFTDPALDMPSLSFDGGIAIELNFHEIGFIDKDDNEHLMTYSPAEYRQKIDHLSRKWADAKLRWPNMDDSRGNGSNPNPFEALNALSKYELMNDEHFFFDDLKRLSWAKYKRQNDLAVLIQGILDRTTFFGYTKANLFKDGYEDQIKLVYDKDKGLYDGEMPNFKAFIANCNENSKKGDIFVGHKRIWDKLEREKEMGDHYYRSISIPTFLPADKITKKRDGSVVVTFRWETPRDRYSTAKSSTRAHRFEVDIRKLLNVSHYRMGDCHAFASDPRCRDLYPQWGSLVMAAERYYQTKK